MKIDFKLQAKELLADIQKCWEISHEKIQRLEREYDASKGAPVFTVGGKYSSRGWTEWTQGFQYGSAILQFDATSNTEMLAYGRKATVEKMAPHVSHFGVHDHGFNNVSTYGNLLRLMREGKIPQNDWEQHFYELALKLSGAVQAKRWTKTGEGKGYIYSFNGPHSLFVDTIRSVRALAISHSLGFAISDEHDIRINLLDRAIQHAIATADYSIYYGEGRDSYDVWGRAAHESVFNTNDGNYRCPNSQQGYTGFSTWTRGLAWAMAGFPEQLEYLQTRSNEELEAFGGREKIESIYLKAATATCDFFIENTPTDGIPYWDTGAPNLHKMGDYLNRASDPFNEYEPIDSSAAAIGAQGLLRLGRFLHKSDTESAKKYWQAGLTVSKSLFSEPYLSSDPTHHGLLLHSIYHHPNGWDYIPPGHKIPHGESCMWGDYHLRELALYLQRIIQDEPYYTFFRCVED
ncbi:MAG: glycosyl hydrolase [Bacteroidota bacterium]